MRITSDQAVEMFARYCRARFGPTASKKVRAKAQALHKRGDIEGHTVWSKVADEIDKRSKRQSGRSAPN
jgi:hypothetical protein